MKRIAGISIIFAAIVAAAMLLFLPRDLSHDRAEPEKDRTLELITILGTNPLEIWEMPGRWTVARGMPATDLTDEEKEKLSKLNALPYLQGSRTAPGKESVTINDQDRAFDGLNLFNSGHAAEAFAMNMDGTVLHTWRFDIDDVWPDVPHTLHSEFWRRAHWYPNGDVLAIYEGIGMIKIDKNSNLLWAYRHACHHQAAVTDDGTIYVLTRTARTIPQLNPDEPILEDAIDVVDPNGGFVKQCSVLKSLENSEYAFLLRNLKRRGDIFHTNSIFVFDGSLVDLSPLYKKGNVLVSILTLNTIGIIDFDNQKMVWAQPWHRDIGWIAQHDPTVLENGNILLFDNRGFNRKSRVVEFDPFKASIAWQYAGDAQNDFYSKTCGTSQRLPNGNTLITESDNGRALEVTADGQIVWEYFNPYRAGENGELIATLFELRRVDRNFFVWLD